MQKLLVVQTSHSLIRAERVRNANIDAPPNQEKQI